MRRRSLVCRHSRSCGCRVTLGHLRGHSVSARNHRRGRSDGSRRRGKRHERNRDGGTGPAIHDVAERFQDRAKVLARAAHERGHADARDEALVIGGGGGGGAGGGGRGGGGWGGGEGGGARRGGGAAGPPPPHPR